MKEFEKKITDILADIPATRNSDTLLCIKYWQRYSPNIFTKDGKHIKVSCLHNVRPQSDIQRMRAHIQNVLGLYPPTCYYIASQRNMSRKKWNEYLKKGHK